MAKQQPKIKDPYKLKMRVMGRNGQWEDWKEKGIGEFTDLETAQRSIRLLMALYPNRTKEIEFTYKGELRDYNGNITGQSIILERR